MLKISNSQIEEFVLELKNISASDLGWTAGIVDGEGCINVWKRSRKGRTCRHPGWQVRVTVGNNDPRIINRLSTVFARLHPYTCSREPSRRRARSYSWLVAARAALIFLRVIQPYLISKAEQAALAIELQTRITNQVGLQASSGIGHGRHLSTAEILTRERLYDDMRELNCLGPRRQMRHDKYREVSKWQQTSG